GRRSGGAASEAPIRAGCRAAGLQPSAVLQSATDRQAGAAHAARDAGAGEGAGRAEAVPLHVRWRSPPRWQLRRAPGAKPDRGGPGDERAAGLGQPRTTIARPSAAQHDAGPAPVARLGPQSVDANRRVARRRACFIPAPEMRSCSAVSWRRCLAGGLALLALDVACRRVAPPLAWHTEAGYRWRELRVLSSGGPAFSELTPSRTGIRFTNTVNLDSALWNRHLAQGGGVALGDVDGDGLPDLYVANYKTRSAMDVYPPQERAFNRVVREIGHNRFEVVPKFRKDYRVVDRPEYGLVSMQQRADPDGFYLNDGTGHF